MGTLYLVRHGQASLGADDYDQLSELGQRQSQRLGRYFAERGVAFDAVFTGTLKRHRQTLAGIAEGLHGLPACVTWPGLDEYDSEAVIRAVHAAPMPRATTPEVIREHFRVLRGGLVAWMQGRVQPEGMTSFADFQAGVAGALQQALAHHEGRVLMVSSGGPISTAVGLLLDLKPAAVVELNMRLRNSAVSEFSATPKRHSLLTWNTLPHLDHPDYASWASHA
jgi:broad specificity phosphatase PhoE